MDRIIAQHPKYARSIAVIVLAAGASRRLGRSKQLLRVGDEPLVARAVRLAGKLNPVWIGVVVGAGASRVAAALRGIDVEVVRSRRWRDGLSASLAAGVRRAPRRARRLLVITVDQWRVALDDLERLVAVRGRGPAAAAYSSRIGVPAVFPRSLWPALARLRGDRGAREVLARVATTPVPMPSAATDLDSPADLAALRREWPRYALRACGRARHAPP